MTKKRDDLDLVYSGPGDDSDEPVLFEPDFEIPVEDDPAPEPVAEADIPRSDDFTIVSDVRDGQGGAFISLGGGKRVKA